MGGISTDLMVVGLNPSQTPKDFSIRKFVCALTRALNGQREHAKCGHGPNTIFFLVVFFSFRKPGNSWALERAKYNLVNHYLLVGVTEEMLDFINLLEATLPRFFKGATEYYLNSNKSHLRQTSNKIEPSSVTVARIQESKIWKMENELYEFALEQFKFVKRKLLVKEANNMAQIYFYEKIRPK